MTVYSRTTVVRERSAANHRSAFQAQHFPRGRFYNISIMPSNAGNKGNMRNLFKRLVRGSPSHSVTNHSNSATPTPASRFSDGTMLSPQASNDADDISFRSGSETILSSVSPQPPFKNNYPNPVDTSSKTVSDIPLIDPPSSKHEYLKTTYQAIKQTLTVIGAASSAFPPLQAATGGLLSILNIIEVIFLFQIQITC